MKHVCKLTSKELNEMGACPASVECFVELFPNGAPITLRSVTRWTSSRPNTLFVSVAVRRGFLISLLRALLTAYAGKTRAKKPFDIIRELSDYRQPDKRTREWIVKRLKEWISYWRECGRPYLLI